VKEMDIDSKRDISAEWIKNNVYEALETIENCERRMDNGCIDLIEYIQERGMNIERIQEVKIQNMKLMMTEFKILIRNTKKILTNEQYEESGEKLKDYLNIFNKGLKLNGGEIIKVFKIIKNDRDKRKKIVLTPIFDKLSKDLSILREEMVSNLSHVLYIGKGREREGREE